MTLSSYHSVIAGRHTAGVQLSLHMATPSQFPVSGPRAGQFSLSYLIYLIRCNQYSGCNHSVYTTCTQWVHHPSFGYLDLHFVVLSPDPSPSTMHVHHFLSTLVSEGKKKGLVA